MKSRKNSLRNILADKDNFKDSFKSKNSFFGTATHSNPVVNEYINLMGAKAKEPVNIANFMVSDPSGGNKYLGSDNRSKNLIQAKEGFLELKKKKKVSLVQKTSKLSEKLNLR
jgi:hypothetical protein